MRVRALMSGLTIIVATAATGGCASDRLATPVSSGEAVTLVTAQEAVDQDFRYRQQATVLRDVARSLELEAQVAMQWPDSKQEGTIFMRKAQAMRAAADTAEETARKYRRQAPHNQVN